MRVPCFFYGSYMDPEVLRRFGAEPGHATPAMIKGWRLSFSPHANLIEDDGTVYGFMFSMPHGDLDQLYGPDGYVTTYKAMPVLIEVDGIKKAALTFVDPADEEAPDSAYLESFLMICNRMGLPEKYVQGIRAQADSLIRGKLA